LPGIAKRPLQSCELVLPSDQGRLAARRIDLRWRISPVCRSPREGRQSYGLRRAALQNFPIELFRLVLRLGPELSLQEIDANLVLPERRSPPFLASVEPHQRTMNRFLEWIER
jgi:hypothetical protein